LAAKPARRLVPQGSLSIEPVSQTRVICIIEGTNCKHLQLTASPFSLQEAPPTFCEFVLYFCQEYDEDDDEELGGMTAKLAKQAKFMKQKLAAMGVGNDEEDEEDEDDEENKLWGKSKKQYYGGGMVPSAFWNALRLP
jgi:hypothetical protein